MRILYLSQYFPPEIGATQTRAYEMASNLVSMGHRVTMMTEVPNHPSGIIPRQYRFKVRVIEEMDGIHVVRSWVYATPIKSFRTRMLFYLSFMLITVINSLFFKRKQFDVVYATSPPLFVGLAGLIIAKLRRIPFVFEVRDLWPESAVELGELKNPRYIRYGHTIADLCYQNARGVVVVTKGIYEKLIKKNLPEHKLFLIKNGTNPERYHFIPDQNLGDELDWKGKFVILYAGIHGVAQGLESVIETASVLEHMDHIHFAFIGEGPIKTTLIGEVKKKKLTNVEFLSEVPADEIAKYISLASTCLVPLRKKNLFKGALPSKMFDCWACGKPIILSVDGEAREELEAAKGGLFVEPENTSAMAEAISYMYKNPPTCREMGENGRRYIFNKGYIRAQQADNLAQVLERLV